MRLRDNVVDGQGQIPPATVLAPMVIPTQDVFPGEDDLLVGNADIDSEADNAGERHYGGNRADDFPVMGLYQLGFSKVKQNNGLLGIADTHRLIVLVQNQNLAVHFPIGSICVCFRAEDWYTSFVGWARALNITPVPKPSKNIAGFGVIVK